MSPSLSKRVAGLPVWAWFALVAVGVFVFYRSQASTAAAPAAADVTASGLPVPDTGGGGGGGAPPAPGDNPALAGVLSSLSSGNATFFSQSLDAGGNFATDTAALAPASPSPGIAAAYGADQTFAQANAVASGAAPASSLTSSIDPSTAAGRYAQSVSTQVAAAAAQTPAPQLGGAAQVAAGHIGGV